MFARMAPEMLCQTLKTAPGTVASASDGNEVAARLVARPEFCIPTSIAIAFFLESGRPSTRPTQ